MKIKTFINNYELNNTKLMNLNISVKNRVKAFLMGYLLGLFIVISPIIILFNLTFYTHIQDLLTFALCMVACIFLILSDIFYHKALCLYEEKVKEIKFLPNYILNSIMYLVVCLISFVAIILIL